MRALKSTREHENSIKCYLGFLIHPSCRAHTAPCWHASIKLGLFLQLKTKLEKHINNHLCIHLYKEALVSF